MRCSFLRPSRRKPPHDREQLLVVVFKPTDVVPVLQNDVWAISDFGGVSSKCVADENHRKGDT